MKIKTLLYDKVLPATVASLATLIIVSTVGYLKSENLIRWMGGATKTDLTNIQKSFNEALNDINRLQRFIDSYESKNNIREKPVESKVGIDKKLSTLKKSLYSELSQEQKELSEQMDLIRKNMKSNTSAISEIKKKVESTEVFLIERINRVCEKNREFCKENVESVRKEVVSRTTEIAGKLNQFQGAFNYAMANYKLAFQYYGTAFLLLSGTSDYQNIQRSKESILLCFAKISPDEIKDDFELIEMADSVLKGATEYNENGENQDFIVSFKQVLNRINKTPNQANPTDP